MQPEHPLRHLVGSDARSVFDTVTEEAASLLATAASTDLQSGVPPVKSGMAALSGSWGTCDARPITIGARGRGADRRWCPVGVALPSSTEVTVAFPRASLQSTFSLALRVPAQPSITAVTQVRWLPGHRVVAVLTRWWCAMGRLGPCGLCARGRCWWC